MLVNRGYVALALASGVSIGCAQLERASVGQTSGGLELGDCFGARTRCETMASVRDIRVNPDGVPGQACVRVEGAPWQLDWQRSGAAVRCASLGFCPPRRASVAPDGTLWTVGMGASPVADNTALLAGVFLSHYRADGVVIAERVVETRRLQGEFDTMPLVGGLDHGASLIAGADGSVFVATWWNDAAADNRALPSEYSLAKYDPLAEPLVERVPILGLEDRSQVYLSLRDPDALYVLAARVGVIVSSRDLLGSPSTLAKLDLTLRPVWIQDQAARWVEAAASVSTAGEIGVMTTPPPSETDPGYSRLVVYDADGNPTHQLSLTSQRLFTIGTDPTGHPFVLEGVEPGAVTVRKLTRTGDVVYRAHLGRDLLGVEPTSGVEVLTLGMWFGPTGSLYFAHMSLDAQAQFRDTHIVELDASGQTCVVSDVLDEHGMPFNIPGAISPSPDGSLFFDSSTAIGRLSQR